MSAEPPRSRSFRERVDEMLLRAMEEDPAFLWHRRPNRPARPPTILARPNVLLPRRQEDDETAARAPILSPAAEWATGKRWWRYKIRFVQTGARA